MKWLLNGIYGLLLIAVSPIALYRMIRHGRYRRGLSARLLGRLNARSSQRECIWFHAVSVGEVLQLENIVRPFLQSGNIDVVITTSTDTGYDLAISRFPDCHVDWFPLDFSWAVKTAFHRVRPKQIVLVELELWPNFLSYCRQKNVSTHVINARLSERSFKGYSTIQRLMKPVFAGFDCVAAQDPEYAQRFIALGTPAERVHVTGSIKFDAVETNRNNQKTQQLKTDFGWSDAPVFIAGSTQSPEEEFALQAWQKARKVIPDLKLILVPRHAQRFDSVAELLTQSGHDFHRRTQPTLQPADIVLLDTIGELSACWGLADVAFVGGSFGSRGGQNMLEPAAFGAAVMLGPNTRNFREIVRGLEQAEAALTVESPEQMSGSLLALLTDDSKRERQGQAAQQFVMQHRGAIGRTLKLLIENRTNQLRAA